MEKQDDSIYFIYPRNYDLELLKEAIQGGFVVSVGKPTLMSDGVQTFTEEDVANFGIENLCKKCMTDNANSCIVLRIPKFYLGLAENSEIDMSPIFSQTRKAGFPDTSYAPMHSFVYGEYSPLLNGYISSPNYSPVCNCCGILTDEQRIVAEKIAGEPGNPRSKRYLDMLKQDEKVRIECPNIADLSKEKLNELEQFYIGEGSPFVVARKVLQDDLSRHRITDEEFNRAIINNQNMTSGNA